MSIDDGIHVNGSFSITSAYLVTRPVVHLVPSYKKNNQPRSRRYIVSIPHIGTDLPIVSFAVIDLVDRLGSYLSSPTTETMLL